MRILLFLFICTLTFSAFAQNNFQIGYQEFPTTILGQATDADGNLYYTGQFKGKLTVNGSVLSNGEGLEDLFWVKTTPDGNVLQHKTFSSPNGDFAISDGLTMGSYNDMYFLSWSSDDLQFDNTIVPAYRFATGSSFVSTISSINTSGALQWIRRTNMNLSKVTSKGKLVHVIGKIFPSDIIKVEDSTVFTAQGLPGLLHMIFDTSGKFLGKKFIGASSSSAILTLQQVYSYDEESLLFSIQYQGSNGFTVNNHPVTLPAPFGQYHVLLRTIDTSYSSFQKKVLNPNLNQVYGSSTTTLTSDLASTGFFYAVLSPQSGPAVAIDGFPIPFNRNTLVVFDYMLNVYRTASLGPSLVATYTPSPARRRIYFRSLGIMGDNLYLTGQYVGINEKPMNAVTPKDTLVPILGNIFSNVDLNGPSKSFVARTDLSVTDSKITWIGEHTPYEHANLYPTLLHTANANRFAFLMNRDNVWNPWVVDTSLTVITGAMKPNADRPDIPHRVSFYPDGSKVVLSYAAGKTALDNASNITTTSLRRDLLLACFNPNGTLKWHNRIESTLYQPSARKFVFKNNKAWFLASYIGTQNDSNFIKVDDRSFNVKVNASLLCSIDADGKMTVINLPHGIYKDGIIQDFSFFQNGDLALLVNTNVALFVPGFTKPFGNYLFRINPTNGAIIDTRQYTGPVYHIANSLEIDNDDMLYISSKVMTSSVTSSPLALYSAGSELDVIELTNNADSKQHISLLKMSWNKFQWVKRFYGDAEAQSKGYNDLFLLNNNPLLSVTTVTNSQPLHWENTLVHQDAYANLPTLVLLDKEGNLQRSRHLPLPVTNYIRKSENEQLFVNGALFSATTIDTIQISHSGSADGISLIFDSTLTAKRMFRIASPFSETMYDMDTYQDSVAVFAYSAQTTPGLFTYRTSVMTKDYDPTAFVTTVPFRAGNTLPVKLHGFTAHLQSSDGVLLWQTTAEEGLSAYDVERSSNGRTFANVGRVQALGQQGINQYSFSDKNISSLGLSVVYYRLKPINTDGTFFYSKVIPVNISSQQALVTLYPNPARENTNLSIAATKAEIIQYRIVDGMGRTVTEKTFAVNKGLNNITIATQSLSLGLYTLHLNGSSTKQEFKFVKQ